MSVVRRHHESLNVGERLQINRFGLIAYQLGFFELPWGPLAQDLNITIEVCQDAWEFFVGDRDPNMLEYIKHLVPIEAKLNEFYKNVPLSCNTLLTPIANAANTTTKAPADGLAADNLNDFVFFGAAVGQNKRERRHNSTFISLNNHTNCINYVSHNPKYVLGARPPWIDQSRWGGRIIQPNRSTIEFHYDYWRTGDYVVVMKPLRD